MSEINLPEAKARLREFFSDPARWTRGAVARDREGYSVSVADEDAVCWCLVGAVVKLFEGPSIYDSTTVYLAIADDVRQNTSYSMMVVLNDEGGYETVMEYLSS